MLDVYKLNRSFWDFAFENPTKIKPNHVAIYQFAIEHCNRLGWKKEFGFPTSMVLEATGIKSYSVFKTTFDELVNYGFIQVIEYSKNQWSSNIIALKENYKANIKALDKALIKHTSKHKQCTCQSTDSINIQLYNITNLQCTNILSYVSDLKSDLIECFLNSIEVDDLKDFLEERKKVAPKKESQKIDFEIVWDLYDKKKGDKDKLKIRWDKLSFTIQQLIIEHIPKYKKEQPDKQFRKHFETYLNNKSYNDEILTDAKDKRPHADRSDDSIFDSPADLHS